MNQLHLVSLLLLASCAGSLALATERSGEHIFKKRCTGCHALDESHWGPALRGVVGRAAASVSGFEYSTGLQAAHFVWDESHLDQWLQNPAAMAPGTRMSARFPNEDERRAVIAFLREQSSGGQ